MTLDKARFLEIFLSEQEDKARFLVEIRSAHQWIRLGWARVNKEGGDLKKISALSEQHSFSHNCPPHLHHHSHHQHHRNHYKHILVLCTAGNDKKQSTHVL